MSRVALSRLAALIAVVACVGSSAVVAAPRTHAHSLVGTLQKVDGQTLTVQTAKGLETVTLGPSAKVHAGSKTLAASELSAHTGAKVKVHYTDTAGQKQAESVQVSSAKKAAQTASNNTSKTIGTSGK
jgi:hypothetical protein